MQDIGAALANPWLDESVFAKGEGTVLPLYSFSVVYTMTSIIYIAFIALLALPKVHGKRPLKCRQSHMRTAAFLSEHVRLQLRDPRLIFEILHISL